VTEVARRPRAGQRRSVPSGVRPRTVATPRGRRWQEGAAFQTRGEVGYLESLGCW